MIKQSIHQQDRAIINIHAYCIRAPKHIKQILTSEGRNTRQYSDDREHQYPTSNNR